eukprot:13963210-Alexandrium_andersonii.AAC.1
MGAALRRCSLELSPSATSLSRARFLQRPLLRRFALAAARGSYASFPQSPSAACVPCVVAILRSAGYRPPPLGARRCVAVCAVAEPSGRGVSRPRMAPALSGNLGCLGP